MTDRAFPLLRLTALGGGARARRLQAAAARTISPTCANDADPAVTSALNDQILVDEQSRRPVQQAMPPGPRRLRRARPIRRRRPRRGKARARRRRSPRAKGCSDAAALRLQHGLGQPARAQLPGLSGRQVTEAAANNSGGCSTRVVTFATADDWQRVLNWYHTKAVRAGYSSEHQIRDGDHILAGANEADKGAFYLIVTPKPKGSEVALIANNGR